jgi:hypothetical protein
MSLPSPAIVAAAVIRSILQALGMEQVVIDFVAVTAIGILAVLSAIVLVGIRSSRSIQLQYRSPTTRDRDHCCVGPATISSLSPSLLNGDNSCPLPTRAELSCTPQP